MALPPVSVKTASNGDVNVGINAGQTVGATQGTAAASAGAWPVKITDGVDDATVGASNAVAAGKGLEVLPAIANTSAPSLTDGRAAALSLDANGNVRVTLASATVTADTEVTTKDYDSGAGTDTVGVVGILLPKSGGAVAGGTAADPLRTDPTGTTTQPVSIAATVTVDSELPAAGALADGASNPTTPTVGAGNLVYNGTTWDRVRGDTTNGIDVDVTRITGTVTTAPTPPTNPTIEYLTATAIAAAGNTTLNSAEIGAVTKKLRKINVATTAQCRIELYRVIATVQDTNPSWVWITSNVAPSVEKTFAHQDFVSLTGTGGAGDNFRVKVFNVDAGATADVYVTLEHAEN